MTTGGDELQSRWARVWDGVHALAIVVSTLIAYDPEERMGAPFSSVLPFALLLLAWHAAAIARRRIALPRRAMPDAVLVAVSAALALHLVARAPVFLMAAGTLFAVIYARVTIRAATVVAVAYGAALVWVVLPVLGHGFALAMGSAGAGCVLLSLFIDAVVRQSAERKRLLDELAEAREQLQTVERRAGALLERERIARELHDTVTQDLVGLRLLLGEELEGRGPADPGGLEDARALAARALATARGLVSAGAEEGHPAGAVPPLSSSLRELAGSFRREVDCDVDVVAAPDDALPAAVRLALFRVARESLANAKKHASARRVTITLDVTPREALLDVQDDGVGFETECVPEPGAEGGFGLWSLRRSIAELGGSLDIESARGEGTTIGVRVPLAEPERLGSTSRAP